MQPSTRSFLDGRTRERHPDSSLLIHLFDGVCTSIGSRAENDDTKEERGCTCTSMEDVPPGEGRSRPNAAEPHDGWDIEAEATDKDGCNETEEVVEKGDSFGDTECHYAFDGEDQEPYEPSWSSVNEAVS